MGVTACLKADTPTRGFQEPKRMRLSSPLLKRPRSRFQSRGKINSLTTKQSPSHGQILQSRCHLRADDAVDFYPPEVRVHNQRKSSAMLVAWFAPGSFSQL